VRACTSLIILDALLLTARRDITFKASFRVENTNGLRVAAHLPFRFAGRVRADTILIGRQTKLELSTRNGGACKILIGAAFT
jgi:hypothetical protein